jgi:hypothetical protein
MHQGMPKDQRPDPLLQRVVEIITEALGTATIRVTSNLSTTWRIQPGGISGSGAHDY